MAAEAGRHQGRTGQQVGEVEGPPQLPQHGLLPVARGHGCGQRRLDTCLGAAVQLGFRRCYLETLDRMHDARKLYERNGFTKLRGPMGNTGHFSCNTWYMKGLSSARKTRET